LGAAVADALGAPFEFKPAGTYKKRFAQPVLGGAGELVGGGGFGWAPGEFTDDTQMALAMAEAFLANGGEYNPSDVWDHFVAWAKTARDIGSTTSQSLYGRDYRTASREAHEALGRTGSNGRVMRTAPLGLLAVRWGRDKTYDIARHQSQLTHFDEVAGWSSAVAAEVIRSCILGAEFEEALQSAFSLMPDDVLGVFNSMVNAQWTRDELIVMNNGGALVCLAQAVWAIRSTETFEDAVVTAVNLGGDADTVAAVCGGMAGALYGIQRIPARWVTYVNGSVRQPTGEVKPYFQHDLIRVAHELLGKGPRRVVAPESLIPATLVHDMGIHASNLVGAQQADPAFGVISLCRMEDTLHHIDHRREFYVIDKWNEGHNPHLGHVVEDAVKTIDAFLKEGKEVLVHCHGGRSRTGFILKAWYMRRYGVDHDDAHDWLQQQWPHYVTWNDDFNEFLTYNWGTK
jgi:ADP-ribosyl-[dinitrogen reductase] hydrolase